MNKALPASPFSSFGQGWKKLSEKTLSGKVQRKVKIEGKELSCPPLEVFKFKDLQILKMTPERENNLSCHMSFIPKEIQLLTNLTALYLDTNELGEIPPEVGTLKNLRRLTLSNNSLQVLPAELAKLQNLQSLHLANNGFTVFPVVICQLLNLTFLDISDNQLEAIPPSINQLRKLQTFLLMINRIKFLPEEFCCLTKLSCLWLGNNELRELPVGFGDLIMLDWGYNYCSYNLEGNPLHHPPIEVCSRGPKEMKEYFDSLY
ncbi:malignant fibrous histiocytoma-amplified sequence 1 homolog [Rana temporaria]|uniref:malignant fibrous histiocytoma-amplified sequence 1 homolog n=1 Tax=Rana temporaria TaxID=8407 RepID=UPI001AACE236|nr:malignant fibrous histiocytoma-amplified sequence 1 homolog [Rana temporaria]